MLKFLLMILASSLLTQAVPVPATTNCSDYSHKLVDIVSHIGENGEINLERHSNVKFPAKELFPCGLPNEFTIAISYNSTGKKRKDRCLFYLDNPATDSQAALAVCFEPDDNKLRVEYQSQTFQFDAPEEIFDSIKTHKIVITATLNSVTVTIDCATTQTLPLTRTNTSPIGKEGTFHLGGITSPVFVGTIDQLEITPSSDNSYCGEVKPHCDNATEGLLWYNHTSNILYKCEENEWTRIGDVFPTTEDNQCAKKLNYLELSQDLESFIKSSHIKQFVIEGVGSFLALAIYQDDGSTPTNSLLYIKDNGKWVFYQYFETHNAQAIEFLIATPSNTPLLVVANKAGTTSPVYKWDFTSKQFTLHQKISTQKARDVESFEISGVSYLAVANHAKTVSLKLDYNINSVIYKWDGSNFVEYQQIPTKGAIDFEHFKIQQYDLLAVANVFDGLTTRVDSTIYFFDSNTELFRSLQSIPTIGATDWEYFEVNGDHYLVVANTIAYTKQTTAPTQLSGILNPTSNAPVHSTIYKLDTAQVQFKPYQEIETFKASDWETFKVGCNHYLIVSNSGPDDNDKITSVVYQYQGLEQFVPVHSIKLHGAASWELYSDGDEQFLACASNLSGETKVIKLMS